MIRRERRSRFQVLHAKTLTALHFIFAFLVANRCIDRHWTGAGVALAAFSCLFLGWHATLLVLVGAAAVGQGLIAGLAATGLGLHLAPSVLPLRWFRTPFDPALLALAVEALPAELSRAIGRLGTPTTTGTLVSAARQDDPHRWTPFLAAEPTAAFEGPPLPSLDSTQADGEAVALAAHIARDLSLPLDIHLVAVAAAWMPGSTAAGWVRPNFGDVPEAVLGIYDAAFFRSMVDFAATSAGADVSRRLEVSSRLDGHAPDVPGKWLFARRPPARGQWWRRPIVKNALDTLGLVAFVASAPYWLTRDWLRARRARADTAAKRPTGAPAVARPPRRRTRRGVIGLVVDAYRDMYRWRGTQRFGVGWSLDLWRRSRSRCRRPRQAPPVLGSSRWRWLRRAHARFGGVGPVLGSVSPAAK